MGALTIWVKLLDNLLQLCFSGVQAECPHYVANLGGIDFVVSSLVKQCKSIADFCVRVCSGKSGCVKWGSGCVWWICKLTQIPYSSWGILIHKILGIFPACYATLYVTSILGHKCLTTILEWYDNNIMRPVSHKNHTKLEQEISR